MLHIQETGARELTVTGNGDYRLIVPLDYGPRVMSLQRGDSPNLFQILTGEDPNAELRIRGGHRLWVAPERKAVTWVDDNLPVTVGRPSDDELVVRGGREERTGLVKEMSIRIENGRVRVAHRVHNDTNWNVELAPWALTIMNPGGWAVAPFPPRGVHPVDLEPSNPFVMWPYTDLSDPRWKFFPRCFTLRQDSSIVGRPQKMGSFAAELWCAYVWKEYVFRKSAKGTPGLRYADMGCNFELFSNHEMLELETLGPVTTLAPGASAEHVETWEVEPTTPAVGTAEAPGAYFGV